MAVETGTCFGHTSRHVAMASELRLREEFQQLCQKLFQVFELLRGKRVSGMSFRVQSAFIAYTDGAPVERTAVGTHFEQSAMLTDGAVATDVKVITDSTEATGTMVAQELFYGVVAVTACGGTVQNDIAYGVGGVHHQSAFHPDEEFALSKHFLLAHNHRKCFLYHGNRHSMAVEQLVIPSAVRAAMAAWIMALSRDTQVILFFFAESVMRFIIYNL